MNRQEAFSHRPVLGMSFGIARVGGNNNEYVLSWSLVHPNDKFDRKKALGIIRKRIDAFLERGIDNNVVVFQAEDGVSARRVMDSIRSVFRPDWDDYGFMPPSRSQRRKTLKDVLDHVYNLQEGETCQKS